MCPEPDWLAVYRASRYAFPLDGAWVEFALDAEELSTVPGLRVSVTLVTAWNPNSEELAQSENAAANARLLRRLEAENRVWDEAWGGALPGVDPQWREEGFAVFGLSREEACTLGRAFGQRAVVFLELDASYLLFCADGTAHACGVRRF